MALFSGANPATGSAPVPGQVDDHGRPETPAEQAVEKRRNKQLAIAGVGAGLAGLLYVVLKSRSAASSSTSGYSYPTLGDGTATDSTGTDSTSDDTNSILSQLQQNDADEQTLFGNLSSSMAEEFAGLTAAEQQQASNPTSASSPPKSTSPTTPNYQTIDIGGTVYDVLGALGAKSGSGYEYTGYEVGGGAPVYAGNAAGGVAQGYGNYAPGNYLYTPVANQNLISKTQVTNGTLPGPPTSQASVAKG